MSKVDANPDHPKFIDDYVLREVDADWLLKSVKPKHYSIPIQDLGLIN